MENSETTTINPEITMPISNEIRNYLLESSKWAKFLAIVGFVGVGLLVIFGFAFMIGFSIFSSMSQVHFPIGIIGIIYIAIAVVYFFPVNYLYKFSDRIKKGITSSDQATVISAFENLKSMFKFMGIFTIVILSIYVLLLVVALPMAAFMMK
jgi:hypothetical protein